MTQISVEEERLKRDAIIEQLVARDGTVCQYPGCDNLLDFSVEEGPFAVTIDHWFPKWYGIENKWTRSEIWDLSNLKLMERKCNARKGDLIPNEDGTLPEKPARRKFRYRRDKRAQRPEVCTSCNSGRNLDENEWCNACGSGPQPARYPKWRQMSPKDCDHDLFFCWACHLDPAMRRSALDALISGGDGYE